MTMKLVPIKNAFLYALEETDTDTGIGKQMLNRWAKKAETSIGLQRMHRRCKVIDPLTSNFIDPPEDAINIKYIYDGNVLSDIKKDLDESDESISSEDTSLQGYVWTPLNSNYLGENMWDLQGGQILFDTAKVGSVITIDYTAFPLNENNDIIVPDYHLDAISYYIQYRMARVMRWKMMTSAKMMRRNESYTVDQMKNEWISFRNEAKAETAKRTPFDKYKIDLYIAEMTGSFIQNFED